jgi:hypothetical protein
MTLQTKWNTPPPYRRGDLCLMGLVRLVVKATQRGQHLDPIILSIETRRVITVHIKNNDVEREGILFAFVADVGIIS